MSRTLTNCSGSSAPCSSPPRPSRRRPIDATIEERPTRTDEPFRGVVAHVVATRQQFVYPRTNPTDGVTQQVVRHESGLGPAE